MPASGKRLDLRFGTFACSVQGFDDPVQPVQQILRAIQHLLEESPELADTAINFDAEAIEQLIGEVARRAELDEGEIEIVPGLVIVHHGSGGDLALDAATGEAPWPTALAADATDGVPDSRTAEAWQKDGLESDSWQGAGREEESWQDDPRADDETDRGGAGYVNIFPPANREAAVDEDPEATGADADTELDAEDMVARLRRMADAGEADYGWDDPGARAGDHAGDQAGDLASGGDPVQHLGRPEREAPEDPPVNVFAATDHAAAEPEDAGAVRNLFAVVEDEADEAPRASEDDDDWQLLLGAPGPEEDAPEETAETSEAADGYTAAGLAERAEARTVPELIVAAAAWMVLIRGQTQFTRRDVLDVFDSIPGDHENTPEVRIKGFGKAVRNGHLVMVEEGIFGISRDDLEYFQKLL